MLPVILGAIGAGITAAAVSKQDKIVKKVVDTVKDQL